MRFLSPLKSLLVDLFGLRSPGSVPRFFLNVCSSKTGACYTFRNFHSSYCCTNKKVWWWVQYFFFQVQFMIMEMCGNISQSTKLAHVAIWVSFHFKRQVIKAIRVWGLYRKSKQTLKTCVYIMLSWNLTQPVSVKWWATACGHTSLDYSDWVW